jgi:hypothetical protein
MIARWPMYSLECCVSGAEHPAAGAEDDKLAAQAQKLSVGVLCRVFMISSLSLLENRN